MQEVHKVPHYFIVLSSFVVSKTVENPNMLFCYRLNITRAWHVARMGETRTACTVLWGKRKDGNDMEDLGGR